MQPGQHHRRAGADGNLNRLVYFDNRRATRAAHFETFDFDEALAGRSICAGFLAGGCQAAWPA